MSMSDYFEVAIRIPWWANACCWSRRLLGEEQAESIDGAKLSHAKRLKSIQCSLHLSVLCIRASERCSFKSVRKGSFESLKRRSGMGKCVPVGGQIDRCGRMDGRRRMMDEGERPDHTRQTDRVGDRV